MVLALRILLSGAEDVMQTLRVSWLQISLGGESWEAADEAKMNSGSDGFFSWD